MNVQGAASSFERLYFAARNKPCRLGLVAANSYCFGLLLNILPLTGILWLFAFVIVWHYVTAPFLCNMLPFSETAREFWHERRQNRRRHMFAEPECWLANSVGLALAGQFALCLLIGVYGVVGCGYFYVTYRASKTRSA